MQMVGMRKIATTAGKMRRRIRRVAERTEPLAAFPALAFGGWLWGDEAFLLTLAGAFPALLLGQRLLSGRPDGPRGPRDATTGLHVRSAVVSHLDAVLADSADTGMRTACLAVGIDDFERRQTEWGEVGTDTILAEVARRLKAAFRDADTIGTLGGGRLAVALAPARRMSIDSLVEMANRVQRAVAEPVTLDANTVHLTASVGICPQRRVAAPTGDTLLRAATAALTEARRQGPASVRVYDARSTPAPTPDTDSLAGEVAEALESGAIRPWFQPQLCTDTGVVSGFEALARWVHPARGTLLPHEFLPAVEAAGHMQRLSEVILNQALVALRGWRKAGFPIPAVAVNLSTPELRDPQRVEKIAWEVDRLDLEPSDLVVEILETVFADNDDMVTRNIRGLAKRGFSIDLDDFGTGHASIANIRRFQVKRIKIDRSFVTRVDQDPEQRRMITAILSLAERLGLDTVAEGVESIGEHALLAQLGCGHVQGFGIARPMPFEDTLPWLERHRRRLETAPRITRSIG
ncbi:MAG: bifunctional diguanylate cyclase/phosphodiesterase [Alphaproteobacteria bacterium]|nr:MAG: bifunctional diguanylate cyclase/phosphodiesterase [Alphaproteobacteria bacterium]